MLLRQLAFASRARLGLRTAHTSELIATSRSNNARDGITGVLLYSGESFLQIIEGRDAAIGHLWRRLLLDDRHRELTTLFERSGDRWFDDWRAGYVAELKLGPQLLRWRALAPSLPPDDITQIRDLCDGVETF